MFIIKNRLVAVVSDPVAQLKELLPKTARSRRCNLRSLHQMPKSTLYSSRLSALTARHAWSRRTKRRHGPWGNLLGQII